MDGDAVRDGALAILGKLALVPGGRDALLAAGVLRAVAQAAVLDVLLADSFSSLCFILAGMGPGFSSEPPPAKEHASPLRSVAAFVRAALALTAQTTTRKAAGVAWVPAAVRGCFAVSGAPRLAAAAFARAGGFATLLAARRVVFAAAVRGDKAALKSGPTFDGGLRALAGDLRAAFGGAGGGADYDGPLLVDPYAGAVASSKAKFSALMSEETGLSKVARVGLSLLLSVTLGGIVTIGGPGPTLRLVEEGAEGSERAAGGLVMGREKAVDPQSVCAKDFS
jgi:hypothetical protein